MGGWRRALGLMVLLIIVIAVWNFGIHSHGSSATSIAAKSRSSAMTSSPASTAGEQSNASFRRTRGHPEFEATFTGDRLNTTVWGSYPWESQAGCMNFGNVKAEDEWYMPSQDLESGAVLRLVASRRPTEGKSSTGAPKEYDCRSGMITTYPSFRFEYGYIQVVARIPSGAGLWPALWLAAADLKWPPEVDLLEAWGGPTPSAGVFFHNSTPAGTGVEGMDLAIVCCLRLAHFRPVMDSYRNYVAA